MEHPVQENECDLDDATWKEVQERFESHLPRFQPLWKSLAQKRISKQDNFVKGEQSAGMEEHTISCGEEGCTCQIPRFLPDSLLRGENSRTTTEMLEEALNDTPRSTHRIMEDTYETVAGGDTGNSIEEDSNETAEPLLSQQDDKTDNCSATSETSFSSGDSTVVNFEVSFDPSPKAEEDNAKVPSFSSVNVETSCAGGEFVEQRQRRQQEQQQLVSCEEQETPVGNSPGITRQKTEEFRSPVIDQIDTSDEEEEEFQGNRRTNQSEIVELDDDKEEEQGTALGDIVRRTHEIILLDDTDDESSRGESPRSRKQIISVDTEDATEDGNISEGARSNEYNDGFQRPRQQRQVPDFATIRAMDEEASLSDSSAEQEWRSDEEDIGETDQTNEDNLTQQFNQSIFIVDSDDEESQDDLSLVDDDDDDFDFSEVESLDSIKVYKRRASLSSTRSPQAPMTKASFIRNRETLSETLFREFDRCVFNGRLATATTVKWSKTLRTTAGKTRMHRYRQDDVRTATIELSTKVLDEYCRLRETLLHEMIHAATWLIDRVDKPGHGACFQRWGRRGEAKFADITVSTRHDYEITYKFKWACVDCKAVIGRQSRSIDVERQVCGRCKGRLVEITEKKKPSAYNLFVKENAGRVRQQMELTGVGSVSQSSVMKECGRLWKARNPSE